MRNLILFALFILLLVAAQFASAKSVDEVIEKYIRARGGRDKLASLKSIYMEGIKEVMGTAAVVKIIKEQGKLSHTQITSGDMESFVLITDKEARTFSSLSSSEGGKVPLEPLEGLQIETDIAGPLVDYTAKGHKAVLLGKEIVEDTSCYKIRLTTIAGKEIMFWLDAATYLIIQASGTAAGDNSGRETVTLYKNYKEIDGIQFPHTEQIKSGGNAASGIGGETSFFKIIVNPLIDQNLGLPGYQS